MSKRQLPLICVLLALALVLVATRFYPGGTLDDPSAFQTTIIVMESELDHARLAVDDCECRSD